MNLYKKNYSIKNRLFFLSMSVNQDQREKNKPGSFIKIIQIVPVKIKFANAISNFSLHNNNNKTDHLQI